MGRPRDRDRLREVVVPQLADRALRPPGVMRRVAGLVLDAHVIDLEAKPECGQGRQGNAILVKACGESDWIIEAQPEALNLSARGSV